MAYTAKFLDRVEQLIDEPREVTRAESSSKHTAL
jgi:hypothetical protein